MFSVDLSNLQRANVCEYNPLFPKVAYADGIKLTVGSIEEPAIMAFPTAAWLVRGQCSISEEVVL